MKIKYFGYANSIFFILLLISTPSCSGRSGRLVTEKDDKSIAATEEISVKLIKLVSPDENSVFKVHDPIKVVIERAKSGQMPDSVLIYFDSKKVAVLRSEPLECLIPSSLTGSTGRKSLKVTPVKDGKIRTPITRFMIIRSDIIPKKYGYKVINVYPHDREAFTHGLYYDNGLLYEGTGQEAGSSLREVELETGKVRRQHNLEPPLFGEGITLYHDRIYQVTWQNKVGFVYEKSTFKMLNKIFYSTEGWGLTTIDNRIFMSDGSNVLYILDPEMFTIVSRIEVYDNEKKVDQLNELEYINGEIWANIWQSDLIARIDPVSGRVNGYIDLKGILPESDRDYSTDVLNGIAYDKVAKRIFVTGKRWPKLFEVKITE
jgi:glutaminyl-peptide cyclotransferase